MHESTTDRPNPLPLQGFPRDSHTQTIVCVLPALGGRCHAWHVVTIIFAGNTQVCGPTAGHASGAACTLQVDALQDNNCGRG